MKNRPSIALFALAILVVATTGCSMQPSDRPNWSLNGPKQAEAAKQTQPAKKYGDWNGAGAPKPLTYDDAP